MGDSEKPKLDIVPDGYRTSVSETLRRIADGIDAGTYTNPDVAVLIFAGHAQKTELFAMGKRADDFGIEAALLRGIKRAGDTL